MTIIGKTLGAAAFMVGGFAVVGCATEPAVLSDEAQEIAKETILKGRDPTWIILPYPATMGDGEPLPVGHVMVFNTDVEGNPVPDTKCLLIQDPQIFTTRESPIEASGTSSAMGGGYLNLLNGLFSSGAASARLGVASKNVRSYTIEWGPRTKTLLDYGDEELRGKFRAGCANFVKRHRENELADYDNFYVVVGTLTADTLTVEYDLNPQALEDDGEETAAAQSQPALVLASAQEGGGEGAGDEDIPELPCEESGTRVEFGFNLTSKVGAGGSAAVCRAGEYALKFQKPYTVALQLVKIDPFKLATGATDDELATIDDALPLNFVTFTELCEIYPKLPQCQDKNL